jgi:hypothetical protein
VSPQNFARQPIHLKLSINYPMSHFDIAHIRRGGQDMIIVPLSHDFGLKSSAAQREIIARLQVAARAAGLGGTTVPVWEAGGRMMFIAPQPWHPFFRSIDLGFVAANINKRLTIPG